MLPHNLLFTDAFGARGDDVLFADLIKKGIFGQHRKRRKTADNRRQHRKRDVPEVIGYFLIPRQRAEIRRDQPAQREDVEITAASEKDNQQHGKQKRRDSVADDNERAAPDIKTATVVDRFADPQRNGDQINNQRPPQSERDGNRQALLDQG